MAKKKRSTISTKFQLLVATGTVLLLVAFGLFVAWLDASVEVSSNKRTSATIRDVTLKGESVCLGHKGDGPSTLECGVGIKLPGGSIYAVKGNAASKLGVDTKNVELTGTLEIPGDSVYVSDGTLIVE